MTGKEYRIPVVVTDVLSSDNVQITAVAHYGRFGDASGMNVAGLIFDRDNDVEIVVKPKPFVPGYYQFVGAPLSATYARHRSANWFDSPPWDIAGSAGRTSADWKAVTVK